MRIVSLLIGIAVACGNAPSKWTDLTPEARSPRNAVPTTGSSPSPSITTAQQAPKPATCESVIEPIVDAPLTELQRVFDTGGAVQATEPRDVVVLRFAACRYVPDRHACYRTEEKLLRVFLRPNTRVAVISFSHGGIDAITDFAADEASLRAIREQLAALPRLTEMMPDHPPPELVGRVFQAVAQMPWSARMRVVHYDRAGRGDRVTIADPTALRRWACGAIVSFGSGGRSSTPATDPTVPADDIDRRIQEQWVHERVEGSPEQ